MIPASYQYPALAVKIAAPMPIMTKRMNPGMNFARSVSHHRRAAMTAHSQSMAPMFAASRSSHVNSIPRNLITRPTRRKR